MTISITTPVIPTGLGDGGGHQEKLYDLLSAVRADLAAITAQLNGTMASEADYNKIVADLTALRTTLALCVTAINTLNASTTGWTNIEAPAALTSTTLSAS